MKLDLSAELADQLDWHWQNHFRPRLDGLSDEEYLWEPVPGCWSVRARGASAGGSGGSSPLASTVPVKAEDQLGTGEFVLEYGRPEPKPAPVTTIAWRLAHVTVGCLGMRSASHFGGPPMDWRSFDYAGTAAGALAQIDSAYDVWIKGAGTRCGGPGRAVRARRRTVRRVLDGGTGIAYQPGMPAPRRRDHLAA